MSMMSGQLGQNVGYMHGVSSSNSMSNSGNIFKRFSIQDLFDEQYGHLQRNDILNEQKLDEKRQIGIGGQTQANKKATLNLFVVSE